MLRYIHPSLLLQRAARIGHALRLFSKTGSHFSAVNRLETYQSEKLTDIGTRRIFDTEHDIFRQSARNFFREEISPYESAWAKAGQVDRDCWLKAGERGLLGVSISEESGGIGADWLYSLILQEEQMYANSSGPGYIIHSNIVMPYLSKYGTREQMEKYIPDMVAGKKIGAIAMTEPGAGSDVQGIRTNAKRDGDSWIINGSKTFISNGYLSDVVVLVARTETNSKSAAHGLSIFIVEANTPGFTKGNTLKKLGLHGQDTSELFFEDARVPYDALLGGEARLNQGFYTLMQELPQERLLIANMSVGSMEFMFEETREYVKQRKAFGKRIADLQTIQHNLAELKTEVAVTRAFIDQCNELHNVGKLDSSAASMAKYWASEKANFQAYRYLQMFGGNGYMLDYPIAKAYVDLRIHPIYGGTNEIMKELIARKIVKD